MTLCIKTILIPYSNNFFPGKTNFFQGKITWFLSFLVE